MTQKKNIHIVSFQGYSNPFLPILWPSSKTYYEKYGKYIDTYQWIPPFYETQFHTKEQVKEALLENPPDFFGVSLYVWNFELSMDICEWVKETFPNCIIVTGGPHQYFKHNPEWFRKYDFIDASLPSEIYGEWAIADILDNWNHKTNKVDWTKVEQIVFPTNDRSVFVKSPKASYKRDFKWDYAPFKEQKPFLDEYINRIYEASSVPVNRNKGLFSLIKRKDDEDHMKKSVPMIHWKLETTRGCPYACTFCDWGGGTMSKVIVKDLKYVKEDIDVITKYGIATIYVCDANFGINGDRDVEVVDYIAQKKRENPKRYLYVHYGGYAKTNKHFDTLKKIFTIEAENDLSYLYKTSVQSTDPETLANIKRTDLREDEHWQLADWLRDSYGYETHVEIIVGLPGMTLEKWYNEFDECYKHGAEFRAYEWHLLPESEAFNKEYREKYGLRTAKKIMSESKWHIPAEVVVGANSYTNEEYQKMWLSHCIYLLLWRGGIYAETVKDLVHNKGMRFGQFIRKLTEDFYPRLRQTNLEKFEYFEKHLRDVCAEETNGSKYSMDYETNKSSYSISYVSFLMIEYFLNYDKVDPLMKQFLLEIGADKDKVKVDSLMILNQNRINTTKFTWGNVYKYNKYVNFESLVAELNLTMTYSTTGILTANKLI